MGLFNTVQLVGALDAMDRPQTFLKDKFFSTTVLSTTEEIAVDKMMKRKNMAPFVSPNVPAKERAQKGRTVSTFQPATLKPLGTVRPSDLVKRAFGEDIGTTASPESRRLHAVNQLLADQDDEISRREEYMSSLILRTGQVVVSGEDYETQIMDFQRAANQTVVLLGAAQWGETGVSVLDSILDWAEITQKASGGVVTEVILGSAAARIFQKDEDVRAVLDNRRQAGGEMQLGPVAVGAQEQHAAYLGSIGQFNFWTYSQWFEDDDGNEIEVWPEYGCGLVSPSAFDGSMAYGAILDMSALIPLQRFPKNFEEENPSREHVLTQSAPLPVPAEIAGSFYAEVR